MPSISGTSSSSINEFLPRHSRDYDLCANFLFDDLHHIRPVVNLEHGERRGPSDVITVQAFGHQNQTAVSALPRIIKRVPWQSTMGKRGLRTGSNRVGFSISACNGDIGSSPEFVPGSRGLVGGVDGADGEGCSLGDASLLFSSLGGGERVCWEGGGCLKGDLHGLRWLQSAYEGASVPSRLFAV